MNPTPGELLRSKREEKKLTLLQVEQAISIKQTFLQALEDDHAELIPSRAQYRGFLRLYAGYLGLDPQSVLPAERPASPGIEENAPEPLQPTLDATLHPVKPVKTLDAVSDFASKIAEKIPTRSKNPANRPPEDAVAGGIATGSTLAASEMILQDIGKSLEAQREALGLSRADVERQTRIREYYIYALERGKLQELPSTVQGRGMLVNYAEFMNLDSDALQLRFAEALQQRRLELVAAENTNPILAGPESKVVKKIPAWRKFVTPDILLSGGLFALLFVVIMWGAIQVINTGRIQATQPPGSISEILLETPGPSTAQAGVLPLATSTPLPSAVVGTQAVSTSVGSGPVQVVVIARQRAYLRMTVDNEVTFDGRIVPGNVYSFSANKSIQLLTGDASAIQVMYNQEDMGVLGGSGQVLSLDFTLNGIITPTPQFTATPTRTPEPTITQQPTSTYAPATVTPIVTP
jgi:cytoskeletal protein RodZ